MFKSISWQEYFYWLLILGGGYYIIVVAVFYSKDILLKLRNISSPDQPTVRRQPLKSPGGMMGAIRENPTVDKRRVPVTVKSEEIEVDAEVKKPVTPITELLSELKALCQIMMEGGATQTDYLKNIKTSLSRYGHFVGTQHEEEITAVIHSDLNAIQEIQVSTAEIKDLWPRELANSINNHK